MKLTQRQLKQIIKEEVRKALHNQRGRPKRRLAEAERDWRAQALAQKAASKKDKARAEMDLDKPYYKGGAGSGTEVDSIRMLQRIEGVLKNILAALGRDPAGAIARDASGMVTGVRSRR